MGNWGSKTIYPEEDKSSSRKRANSSSTLHTTASNQGNFDYTDYSSITIHRPKKTFTREALAVAHYTPPCFPMIPIVTTELMHICRASWSRVMAPVEKDGQIVSGLTLFYTEFYDIMGRIDRGKYFEKVLKMHTSGLNSIAAKGAIIVRIVNFALALDPDRNAELENAIRNIGHVHRGFQIRPWMYQTFMEAMLSTFSSILGSAATIDVMAAWCHLFGLVMQHMLPCAIEGLVLPNELDANYTGNIVGGIHSGKASTLVGREKSQTKISNRNPSERESSINDLVSTKASNKQANNTSQSVDSGKSGAKAYRSWSNTVTDI